MFRVWHGETVELIAETATLEFAISIARLLHQHDKSGTFITLGDVHYAKYWGNNLWERKVEKVS